MKKLAIASIFIIIFIAGCGISSNDGSIPEIEKSMHLDGIPSKLNIPGENGMGAQVDIVFMDLVEKEIEYLYKNIDDYLSSHEQQEQKDDFYIRDKLSEDSNKQEEIFSKFSEANDTLELTKPVFSKGKEAIIKGMPVLQQGKTETCAIFSSTAAVDMVTGAGRDKYSILRSLQLGKAIFEHKIEMPDESANFSNPWQGALLVNIFAQFAKYGLVEDKGNVEDSGVRQQGFSEKAEQEKWKDYNFQLSQMPAFVKINNLKYTSYEKDDIATRSLSFKNRVKIFTETIIKEIEKGNVVVVGIDMLINSADDNKLWNDQGLSATTLFNSEGHVILDLSKKEDVDSYNTWDTSKELAKAIRSPQNRQKVGRHDMVIIGYCENPYALIDEKGLFILRNSWGKDNAIDGNNFVTYQYAYVFSDEIIFVGSK